MKVAFNTRGSLIYGYDVVDPVTVYDIQKNPFGELEFLIYDKRGRRWRYVYAREFHAYENPEDNKNG